MAYFEALEEALENDMVTGYKTMSWLIRSVLAEMSDGAAEQIAELAEIADTDKQHLIDKAAMDAGKLIIGEIYKYLADNHPTAWGDEGDLSEYQEKLRLDRAERTKDVQAEARIYAIGSNSNE